MPYMLDGLSDDFLLDNIWRVLDRTGGENNRRTPRMGQFGQDG